MSLNNPTTESATSDNDVAVLETAVLTLARDVLECQDLAGSSDVFDYGATSLSFVRLLSELRRRYNITIDPRDLDGEASARSLSRALHQAQTQTQTRTQEGNHV